MGRKKPSCEVGELDMTPMIDCVFQLIIFFIVTMKMNQEFNQDIRLEKAPNGPIIKDLEPWTTEIEVDKRGWISIHGAQISKGQLKNMLINKSRRLGGTFPVMIRGDLRAKHEDIRTVMDICTDIGIWRINFVAIQEVKAKK